MEEVTEEGPYAPGSFFIMPNCVLKMGLTPTQLAVYCMYKRIAGENSKCWASQQKVADACGVSVTTLKTATDALASRGLLRVENRVREDGGKATNLITLLDPVALYNREVSKSVDTPSPKSVDTPSPKSVDKEKENTVKKNKRIILPNENDPALALWRAWANRIGVVTPDGSAPYPSRAEWSRHRADLYDLARNGVTPDEVDVRCASLLQKWKDPKYLTMNALINNWAMAGTLPPPVTKTETYVPSTRSAEMFGTWFGEDR